jgi:hypothetical protein
VSTASITALFPSYFRHVADHVLEFQPLAASTLIAAAVQMSDTRNSLHLHKRFVARHWSNSRMRLRRLRVVGRTHNTSMSI